MMALTKACTPGVCSATLLLAVPVEMVADVAAVPEVPVTALLPAAEVPFEVVGVLVVVVVVATGAVIFPTASAAFVGPMETCGVGPKMLVAATGRAVDAAGVLVATECSTLLNGLLDALLWLVAGVLVALGIDTAVLAWRVGAGRFAWRSTAVCGMILIRPPFGTSLAVAKPLKTGKTTLPRPSNYRRRGKFSSQSS
jgi:hypothetical protein